MILPTGKKSKRSFTLIELLLVIVILGVVAAVAVPNFQSTYSGFLFQKTVNDLAYSMRYAQARAVSRHKIYRLDFEQDFSTFQLMEEADSKNPKPQFVPLKGRFGRIVLIPEKIHVNSSLLTIHFYPDGNVEQAEIELTALKQAVVISTRFQKGAVKVLELAL